MEIKKTSTGLEYWYEVSHHYLQLLEEHLSLKERRKESFKGKGPLVRYYLKTDT